MASKRNIIGGNDGWLRIKLEPYGEIVSVPEHLQVELASSAGGRDFFTVLEGPHRGRKCSVTAGNLSPALIPMRKAASLVFRKSTGVLTCGTATMHAEMAPFNEIPNGLHPIQLPDFPHQGGRGYMTDSKYAKTWFYLGHGTAKPGENGLDRYLHTGMISGGCVTVNPDQWTQLYELICKCRSNDGKTIGTITVRK